jgi:hypothetical protein
MYVCMYMLEFRIVRLWKKKMPNCVSNCKNKNEIYRDKFKI